MVILGMMFFTLGAETSMTPMGEAVGAKHDPDSCGSNRRWCISGLRNASYVDWCCT